MLFLETADTTILLRSFLKNPIKMERTLKLTKIVLKNGKKAIIEETNYEFCEDIWRIIKSYMFYEDDWYRMVIQPYRTKDLTLPEIGVTNLALSYFWRTKIQPNIYRIDHSNGPVETYRSLLRIFIRNKKNEEIRKLAEAFLINKMYDAVDRADDFYRRYRYIEGWDLEDVAKKVGPLCRRSVVYNPLYISELEDEIFKTLKRLRSP